MLKNTKDNFLLILRLVCLRKQAGLSRQYKLTSAKLTKYRSWMPNVRITNQIAFYNSTVNNQASEILTRILTQLSQATPESFPIANHYAVIATLSPEQKQMVVKYTLMAIYKKKISLDSLSGTKLKNFNHLLGEYPEQQLQLNLWKINNLQHMTKQKDFDSSKLEVINNQLNDIYLYCYGTILPKITQHDKKVRAQAIFYKFFGKHLAKNLIRGHPYASKQSLEGLRKSKQFLVASIDNFKEIIKNQMKKTQSQEMEAQKRQNLQKYKIRLSAMKENIRKLVEATGETVYSLFTIVYQKSQQESSEEIQVQKLKHLEEVLFILDDCVKMFQIISGMKTHSIFYHRLRKIYLQIKGVLYVKKPSEQFKKISKVPLERQLLQFYGECQKNLMQALEYPEIVKQITMCMVTSRYHILRGRLQIRNENDLKKGQQKLKKEMMDWCSELIKKVDVQYKNSLMRMLAQVIKTLSAKKIQKNQFK